MTTPIEQERDAAYEQRVREAELRCQKFRDAFWAVMQERFTVLDETLAQMLQVLFSTLNVARVSFWRINETRDEIVRVQQIEAHGDAAYTLDTT